VTVGDDGGGNNADLLIYGSAATGDQIPDTIAVTVASSGRLDLNGKSDALGHLTLFTGPNASASVATGPGTLSFGEFLYSGITVSTFGATDGTAPPAEIAGNLDLGSIPRSITIEDTLIPSPSEDLLISANVTGGTPAAYVAGLREGRLTGSSFQETLPNPGSATQLGVRLGQTNVNPPWGQNETWVYTGRIYDADGIFSFAENIDDNVLVKIDGVTRLRHTAWNVPSTTGSTIGGNVFGGELDFGMGPNGDGWHNIEIRLGNGGGGAGPVDGNGWTATFGFGWAVDGSTSNQGTAYAPPSDDGSGNLFRSAPVPELLVAGAGTVAFTTSNAYSGGATVRGATLVLREAGSLSGSARINVLSGGALVLDNATANADRVGDSSGITLADGMLSLIGHADGSSESVGDVTLASGAAKIQSATNGGVNLLAAQNLTRHSGATVAFIGVQDDLGTADNQVTFSGTIDGVVNGVLPYATLSGPAGLDFVEHTLPNGIKAAPFVTSLAGAADTNNVKLSASDSVTGSQTINALMLLGDGPNLGGGTSLTVTSGQVVSTGGANSIATPTLAFGAAEQLMLTERGSQLTVSSAITGSGTVVKERTGTLVLTGNNSGNSGEIRVNRGLLRIGHGNALGSTGAGTTVANGAALFIDGPLTVGAEPLRLAGNGLNDDGLGALRIMSGIASWAGPVTLDSNPVVVIGVNDGAHFVLTGATANNANGLTKVGLGTLELGGSANNAHTGLTTVMQGTLILNKTANNAMGGSLIVGDFAGTDVVRYGAAAGGDQVPNGQSVTVQGNALFDMATHNKNDQIANLTMSGGTVQTGTAALTMTGTLTCNSGSSALVSGNLNLGNGTRTFAVNDGYAVNDLTIDARVINGGISKTGGGTLVLSNGANNFASGVALSGGTLALGHQNAMGTGTLNVTGNATLRPEGVSLSGAQAVPNAVTLNLPNTQTLVLGGRRDFGGTAAIELAGAVTLRSPGAAETLFLAVLDPQVDARINGNVGGGNNNLVLGKSGIGTLTLAGDNTFTVRPTTGSGIALGQTEGIRIDAGVLRAAHSNALGGGAYANVNVRGDLQAALEIDGSAGGVNITNRHLILFLPDAGVSQGSSLGSLNLGGGVLRNVSGTSSVIGQIDLRNIANNGNGGTVYIGVDSGSLELVGQLYGTRNDGSTTATHNRSLIKVGAGTLRTSGSADNLLTGTVAVVEGTLELNKSGAARAIVGSLVVGDNYGGDDADLLLYVDGAGGDQIEQNVGSVTVNSSGRVDFGSVNDTISALILVVGETSGDVVTGSGTLISTGYTVNVRPGTSAAAAPAVIAGNLNLGTATKTFTVNGGPGAVELELSATLKENASGVGITKAGTGRMVLDPAGVSDYSGAVTINAGVLNIRQNSALGTEAGGVSIAAGSLELESTSGLTIGNEAITQVRGFGVINGPETARFHAILGTGAIRNISGDNVWGTGTTAFTMNNGSGSYAVFGVDAGSLTLNGTLGQSGGNTELIKVGGGTLELAGTASNTYVGSTFINAGTLVLNKTGNAQAIVNGDVFVGDGLGGNQADVLRWASTAGGDQIVNRTLRIGRSGLVDLNGITETNTEDVFLDVGFAHSGDFVLGDAVFTANNLQVIGTAGTTAASTAATITGGTLALGNAKRYAYVRDTAAPIELRVGSPLTSSGTVTLLTKLFPGAVEFAADNSASLPLSLGEGMIIASADGALGTTDAALVVPPNATLAFLGNVNYTSPNGSATPAARGTGGWAAC
jgi:fibronectin-binding autotransporter adhesin